MFCFYVRADKNRMLRRLFGSQKAEVTKDYIIMYEDHDNKCSSPDIIIRMIKPRRMRWAEHVAHMGGTRNGRKAIRKEKLAKSRHRWEHVS